MTECCCNSGRKKYHTDCAEHCDQRHAKHSHTGNLDVMHLDRIDVFADCFILTFYIGNTGLCDNGLLHTVNFFADFFCHGIPCFLRHHRKCLHRICTFRNAHLRKHGIYFIASGRKACHDDHRFPEDAV